MINKNLVYKVPGLSFNVERLTKTYKEILRNKKFDQGDGSVSHIDSISLNKIPGNDDAIRSIRLVLSKIVQAILEAKGVSAKTATPELAAVSE